MGIGFGFIGRKIGEEIDKFIQLIFEARKDDNRNALLYNSAGEDSVPLNEERIILVKVDGRGKYVAVGVLTPSQGAKPGEKIFFARDPDAAIVSKIKMLNDGSVNIDTDTETTDEAAGGYTRKIKGITDIIERKDRNYTNEGNVNETIKKDKTLTIEGNNTETIGGDENRDITGNKTESASGNLAGKAEKNATLEAAQKATIKGSDVEINGNTLITGGQAECNGKASPTGTGCWCAKPFCTWDGSPHTGNIAQGT